MNRTSLRTLAGFLCVCLSGTAFAAPPTAESVERLLVLTKAESMMDSLYGSVEQVMRQSMQQAAGQRKPTVEQQRVLDQLPRKFVEAMRQDFNWSTMKPLYVQLYQETFEQVEVDGLIAFYESPAGQSMINKMPTVIQKSMLIAQDRMQTFLPKMSRMIEDAMKDAGGDQPGK